MLDRLVAAINGRFSENTSATWPISLARIALGFMWLAALRWKLPPDFDGGSETSLRGWLELQVEHPAFGFYGSLVDSVVLPNFTFFAWLVFVAELAIGLALVLGLFTRPAALVGALMSLNLLIGQLDVPGEWPWAYVFMIMLHGIVLFRTPIDTGRSTPVWQRANRPDPFAIPPRYPQLPRFL